MRDSLYRFNCLSVLWTSLHLVEEDQRILISVNQEPEKIMRWYKEALELNSWSNAPRINPPEGQDRVRFEIARSVCIDYCGENSFEVFLLNHGIATSHGQMPQRLRRLMIEMIERRICPITIATASLTEGVNLPFDLIFLTSLKRRSWDHENEELVIAPLSTSEFRNLAGRAGRPGATKGIEGMTLIALPTQISSTALGTIRTQKRQRQEWRKEYYELRETLLLEEDDFEEARSPISQLLLAIQDRATKLGVPAENFLQWLEKIHPEHISGEVGEGTTEPRARLADTLDELDGILLTALEEINQTTEIELTPPLAEAYLSQFWKKTFTAIVVTQESRLERAFALRGRSIIENIYPDHGERQRLYQYGFTPAIGRKFERVAPEIFKIISSATNYGSDDAKDRLDVFRAIGALLVGNRGFGFRVRETKSDQNILSNWTSIMSWWMQEPQAIDPEPDELRPWQRFVADNLEFRLGLAISAVVVRAWNLGSEYPLTTPSLDDWKSKTGLPWFGFWARELLKWGTHDPFVAFALSQGLAQTRPSAANRRNEFNTWLYDNYTDIEAEDLIDPQLFLRWESTLLQPERETETTLPEAAVLTGTRAQNSPYSVIPVASGDSIKWLDPAGFELAITRGENSATRPHNIHNSYELRAGRRGFSIHRVFNATSKHE
jgi:hypothetical protein